MNWDNVLRFNKFISVFADREDLEQLFSSFVPTVVSYIKKDIQSFKEVSIALSRIGLLRDTETLDYLAEVQRYALLVMKRVKEDYRAYIKHFHIRLLAFTHLYVNVDIYKQLKIINQEIQRLEKEIEILKRSIKKEKESLMEGAKQRIDQLTKLKERLEKNLSRLLRAKRAIRLHKWIRNSMIEQLPNKKDLEKTGKLITEFSELQWYKRTIDKMKEYLQHQDSPLKFLDNDKTRLIALLDIVALISLLNFEEFNKLIEEEIKLSRISHLIEIILSTYDLANFINKVIADEEEDEEEWKYVIWTGEEEEEEGKSKGFRIVTVKELFWHVDVFISLQNYLEFILTKAVLNDADRIIEMAYILNAMEKLGINIRKEVVLYNINVLPFLLSGKRIFTGEMLPYVFLDNTTTPITRQNIRRISKRMIVNVLTNELNKSDELMQKVNDEVRRGFVNLILAQSRLEEQLKESVKKELIKKRVNRKRVLEVIDNAILVEKGNKPIEIEIKYEDFNFTYSFAFALLTTVEPSGLGVEYEEEDDIIKKWLIPISQFKNATIMIQKYITSKIDEVFPAVAKRIVEKELGDYIQNVETIKFNTLHPFAFTINNEKVVKPNSFEEMTALMKILLDKNRYYKVIFNYENKRLYLVIKYEKEKI